MNINEIKELLLTIDKTKLGYLKIEEGNFSLEVSTQSNINNTQTNSSEIINTAPIVVDKNNENTNLMAEITNDDIHIIKSPLMGTFYESPGPDESSFVKVGDKVNTNSTLCIIEAMKLMNELTSDVTGEIIEVLVKNEDLVEYNQPLFKVKLV